MRENCIFYNNKNLLEGVWNIDAVTVWYVVLWQDKSSDMWRLAFGLWSGVFRECGAVGVGDNTAGLILLVRAMRPEGDFLQVINTPLDPATTT